MHPRHRNPGNGYRSNSMGMGGIHPEGSARGHGFYNSEYRGFNRGGFGRGQGQPKPFHQPPPPPAPRKGDIFMEAGRLAAEYLVFQGVLPPSVLSGKWQNGTFKSQEDVHLPPDVRASVQNRIGNSGTDMMSGRKRFSDDYNSMGVKNYLRGRRKGGSFRSFGSDWGRDYGRSGSWSDRGRITPEMEVDDDSYSRTQEDQQVGKDIGNSLQKSNSNEVTQKSGEGGSSELELEKLNLPDEMSSRPSSSSVGKDLPLHAEGEVSKMDEESKNMDMETGELRDGIDADKPEKPDTKEDSSSELQIVESGSTGNGNTDLLKFCNFAKVPTRTRSALTYKVMKVDSVSNNDEEKTLDVKLPQESKPSFELVSRDTSVADAPSNKTHNYPNLEISKGPPFQSDEDAGSSATIADLDQRKCMRSQSFPDKGFMLVDEQESSEGLLGLQKSRSMGVERVEKRPIEKNDSSEGTKKPREWFSECFDLSTLSEKKECSQEETAEPCKKVSLATIDNYLFPEGGCTGYAQEKQFFPGSYKIDLNMLEDMNDNHHSVPSLMYAIPKNEAPPVDVALSMSNSNVSGECSRQISNDKAIEIIDLDNDSAPEDDKVIDISDRKYVSLIYASFFFFFLSI